MDTLRQKPIACILAAGLWLLAAPAPVAGKPGTSPGGGGTTTAAPDILYMSDDGSTEALSQAAVRGITLASDGMSGTDTSLQRSKAGRAFQAVTWSPDGRRAAWFEVGLGMVSTPTSIMVGDPAGKAAPVYTSVRGTNSPEINASTDSLAWGVDCRNPANSILVFASVVPAGIQAIRFVNGQPGTPEALFTLNTGNGLWIFPSAFAFSPTGHHLAFAGSGSSGDYGVWLLDMCNTAAPPVQLLTASQIAGTEIASVRSMDWSRNGERLAMSVTTGPDPNYPWRDLKIAEFGYSLVADAEQIIGPANVWRIDLDGTFTAASSEHSPQWGPSAPAGAACQRIAFSQSSDIAPRSLYLLDVNNGRIGGCAINAPHKVGARYPRALDWR